MSKKTAPSLVEHLKQIPDPRVKRTQRHELMDILVIALCATICGADNWVSVVQFGVAKIEWLSTFLKFKVDPVFWTDFGCCLSWPFGPKSLLIRCCVQKNTVLQGKKWLPLSPMETRNQALLVVKNNSKLCSDSASSKSTA